MGSELWNTRNDLPEEVRRAMIGLLNQNLADAIDLAYQAKQAHWNVKGPSFIALHELFDEVVKEIEEGVDDLAEHAVQMGGTANGTVRVAASRSRLDEYPPANQLGRRARGCPVECFGRVSKSSRAAIDAAAGEGDAGTADLFTEISRGVDKLLWKVEAHTVSPAVTA